MEKQVGRVEAIWIKREHREPMEARDSVIFVEGGGIAGNVEQGGKRQVTLLEAELWRDACQRLDVELDPVKRRANLLIRGFSLAGSRGCVLKIGSCQLRVLGESTPCYVMDAVFPGLRKALSGDWAGGVYGEVARGGEIRVGDPICRAD